MNYFVTTAIPYVNGEPHLGHAMLFLYGDVLARSARKNGRITIFSIGTDEHGGKIAEKASELNITPKQLSDKMSQKFRSLADDLDISADRFIRTTDSGHEQRAEIVWENLKENIYKGTYEGWYCTGCEEYVTEAVVKANNGVCPNHNRPYEKLKEENYFFKLSQFQQQIREKIISGEFKIIPETRRNEILQVLADGLEDISISRPKDKISWGIPVPGDENQVMYVWFEALLNYITVLGYPEHQDFKDFWPANVQVIGKDILRFHAAIWPGILLGLGLPLPEKLYVHGFITADGKKMSKSLGNFVTPNEILAKYDSDVFRYFFARHIPSYSDGDFSWQRIEEVYNNELANELGNAVQRTAAMITRHQDGIIGKIPETGHDTANYEKALNECRFDKALESVWERVRGLNQYIEEEKPWEVAKTKDQVHLREVLAYQVACLLQIADLLQPFMPKTTIKIRHVFDEGVVRPLEGTLFPKHEQNQSN
ncbi:methionine--tRNA ligase [Candidatus Saccharibacteria bacterium]|nr:methionine--tRNA ligase [Candidatus Saccharibacteria bacterium]